MNSQSPDSVGDISIKQEEPEDHPHLNILHMVVCEEEVSPEQERSPSLLQEEPAPPQIQEEQEEILPRPDEPMLTLVVVKREEEHDDKDIHLHMVVCKEEVSPGQERSPSLLQEEPEPPQIKDEQEELVQRPDGPMLTLLAVKQEEEDNDKDIASLCSEVDSDTEVTEDSDDWEETSGGMMSHSSQTRVFSCSECPYYVNKSQNYLHKHIKQSHNDLYCQMLRSGQITSAACQQISNSSQTRVFSCSECPYYVNKSQNYLYKHIKQSHNDLYCQMLRSGQITSAACQQISNSVNSQKQEDTDQPRSSTHHQSTFTGKNLHICKHCGKSFSQSAGLKRHQCVHTGEKPFYCKQCDRSFSHLSALKRHHRRIRTRQSMC